MGIVSLVLSVAGIVTTLIHYVNHNMVLGIITTVMLIASLVTGLLDLKHQRLNGGVNHETVNPAVLGHGIAFVVFLLGGIMCIIANIRA